jgi:hypothetical protein
MKTKIKVALWRWTMRKMRTLLDAADDWLHTQEMLFREARAVEHEPRITNSSVDRQASAAREKAIRKTRAPRLRYQGGQFVRVA